MTCLNEFRITKPFFKNIMSTADLQQQLFTAIKGKLPSHLSLADEVAAVLDISTDSAYRRIRGEKPLLLDEVARLCTKYALSLDSLLHLQSDGFLFRGNFFQVGSFFCVKTFRRTIILPSAKLRLSSIISGCAPS
jgi:hypothetical protein